MTRCVICGDAADEKSRIDLTVGEGLTACPEDGCQAGRGTFGVIGCLCADDADWIATEIIVEQGYVGGERG